MSDGLSRRALFGLLRRAEAPRAEAPKRPAADGFSLDGFYRARAESGVATTSAGALPAFALRGELPSVPTTDRGVQKPVEGPRHAPSPIATPPAGTVAHIRPSLCLAWQRSFCSVCVEHCPVEGAIAVENGRPTVIAASCTGCGRCVHVCPAPVNALSLLRRPEIA